MAPARRDDGPVEAATAARKRRRIVALEADITPLRGIVDQQQRQLGIQLERIAKLQADLDATREAWIRTAPGQRA